MRILTCIGDATSIRSHGGLPYHLLEAGRRLGFLDSGWKLNPEKLRIPRALWNLRALASRGEFGGYQYSASFLNALIRQAPPIATECDEIISIFPLFPLNQSRYSSVNFYIDATLRQNFEDYGIEKVVARSIITEVLERERAAYVRAARVLCRSRSCARSVVDDYGIERKKVHVVPGAANISHNAAAVPVRDGFRELIPVRLGFLGKDWKRKDLPFVLQIADALHARGVPVEVVAAGFAPAAGPRHPLLRAIGFIDKHSDMPHFINFIGACHFTCLFSSAEAFGISNRESLRLGVPVLARAIGGIPDTVPEGCGHLFAREAAPADVADVIEAYVLNPERYWQLRKDVLSRSHEFTWDAAIEKMQAIWNGSNAYAYTHADTVHA